MLFYWYHFSVIGAAWKKHFIVLLHKHPPRSRLPCWTPSVPSEDGRCSQTASALQTHCFPVQQLTELCPHIIAREPAPSQKENRKCTVSLWGSSSTLNRVIYHHFISKTCCWGERKVMFGFEVSKAFFFLFFFNLNPKESKPEVPSCLKELGLGHLWPDSLSYIELSQTYLQWADRATSVSNQGEGDKDLPHANEVIMAAAIHSSVSIFKPKWCWSFNWNTQDFEARSSAKILNSLPAWLYCGW